MALRPTNTFRQESEAFRSYCQRTFQIPLEYQFDSVAKVDAILAECQQGLKGMNANESWTYLNNICVAAGAFLGEILVRSCNGVWTTRGDAHTLQNWSVRVPSGPAYKGEDVPVFLAVYNFMTKGPTESLIATVAPFLGKNGTWPKATVVARPPTGKKIGSKKPFKVAGGR